MSFSPSPLTLTLGGMSHCVEITLIQARASRFHLSPHWSRGETSKLFSTRWAHKYSIIASCCFFPFPFPFILLLVGHVSGVLEAQATSALTVRHKECKFISSSASTGVRCQSCVRHPALLTVQYQRLQSSNEKDHPSSSVNYRYLTPPQLASWHQNIHHENCLIRKQCQWLILKLQDDCQWRGVDVDDATHEGLTDVCETAWWQTFPSQFVSELFRKQQQEASTKSDSRGRRWHPLVIRWCLYIHHRSSGAYQVSKYCIQM